MNKKTRIIIAEDHTIIREGLRALLLPHLEFEIIGEAEDGMKAIQLVEKLRPDLVLMDLTMPKMNGTAAIKEIKSRFPKTKILALTVHKSEQYIYEALQAGAEGYVLKYATYEELITAIKNIMEGKRYISPFVSEEVIEGFLEGKHMSKVKTSWDILTPREREILKMVAEGYKTKDIGDYLCISPKTAEKHRCNIMNKLNLHSAYELRSYAIEKKLIDTE